MAPPSKATIPTTIVMIDLRLKRPPFLARLCLIADYTCEIVPRSPLARRAQRLAPRRRERHPVRELAHQSGVRGVDDRLVSARRNRHK